MAEMKIPCGLLAMVVHRAACEKMIMQVVDFLTQAVIDSYLEMVRYAEFFGDLFGRFI